MHALKNELYHELTQNILPFWLDKMVDFRHGGYLGRIAYMSESAFCRFFKLHTGRRLSDYIIDIRMGYAARMLVDTKETIAEISFKCGYNNMSNFNRIFKRKKGCSPTAYRQNYQKTKIIL